MIPLPRAFQRHLLQKPVDQITDMPGFKEDVSAYYAEVLRAGLLSVPPGLAEAGRSTGLTALQTLRYVVLPPAVRNVLPDLLSGT